MVDCTTDPDGSFDENIHLSAQHVRPRRRQLMGQSLFRFPVYTLEDYDCWEPLRCRQVQK